VLLSKYGVPSGKTYSMLHCIVGSVVLCCRYNIPEPTIAFPRQRMQKNDFFLPSSATSLPIDR